MIIINQDNDSFVNFRNIEEIFIDYPSDDYDDNGKFKVTSRTVSDCYSVLAEYTTLEKAQKAVEEISVAYARKEDVFRFLH